MEIFAKCRNIDETRQRIFSRGASMKIGPEKNYTRESRSDNGVRKSWINIFPGILARFSSKTFYFYPVEFLSILLSLCSC